MKAEYGFRDEQVRPFGFNPAPFIADKMAVQQGYVTAEPLTIEKAAGFLPNVFLLADYGFSTYSNTVETRREIVETNPDLVQRFRGCVHDRLVHLSVWRQRGRQRADQTRQS